MHPTLEAWLALFLHVMELEQELSVQEMNLMLLYNIVLIVGSSGPISGWTNMTLEQYNFDNGTTGKGLEYSSNAPRTFADFLIDAPKAHRCSAVLVEEDDNSHWFPQVVLFSTRKHVYRYSMHKNWEYFNTSSSQPRWAG